MPLSDDEIRVAFMADILAHPDDDAPRLVYADWLSERGDPRGELISVQCALHRATGGELARLVNRSSDLLYRHGDAWLGEIRRIVRGVELRRGFVASINATGPVFGRSGALFEREPIEELRLIAPKVRDFATLAKAKHRAKLRSLVFLERVTLASEDDARALGTLLSRLEKLRALDLRLFVAAEAAAATRAVFATVALPALEQLKLSVRAGNDGTDAPAIAGALRTAKLPALRKLAAYKDSLRALGAAFPGLAITPLAD